MFPILANSTEIKTNCVELNRRKDRRFLFMNEITFDENSIK